MFDFLIYFYFLLGHLAPPASPQFLVGVTPKSLKVSFSKKESPTLTPFFLPLPGPATPEKRVFKFPFAFISISSSPHRRSARSRMRW